MAAQVGRSHRVRNFLDGLAAGVMIVASVVVIWVSLRTGLRPPTGSMAISSGTPAPAPAEAVSLRGAWLRGKDGAKVALIEYSDFECPHCAVVAQQSLPLLLAKYVDTGQVLFAFHPLPLERLHPMALKAAEAAECSGRQGRFWQMHDRLFRNRTSLDETVLGRLASEIGLDSTQFAACLNGLAAAAVQHDISEAKALQINGTPTFLLGTLTSDGRVRVAHRVSGAVPFEALSRMLDGLLASPKSVDRVGTTP